MGRNTATDTNTMSAAMRSARSARCSASCRGSTGPLITPIRARAKRSVLPELQRGPFALRDDVGLHRLEPRVVVGERPPARRVLDAPVDHAAQEGDPPELDLKLGIRLRVRVGGVGVAHVAGDADRAPEGLRVVEDAPALLHELLGL